MQGRVCHRLPSSKVFMTNCYPTRPNFLEWCPSLLNCLPSTDFLTMYRRPIICPLPVSTVVCFKCQLFHEACRRCATIPDIICIMTTTAIITNFFVFLFAIRWDLYGTYWEFTREDQGWIVIPFPLLA